MKRINILLAIIIAVLMTACSESLESKARERYKNYTHGALDHKYAKVEISDEKVLLSDDSICVLQYTVYSENYSGESGKIRMEYILFWSTFEKPELMEAFYVLDKKKRSLLDCEISWYSLFNGVSMPQDKEERYRNLRSIAPGYNLSNVIVVKED